MAKWASKLLPPNASATKEQLVVGDQETEKNVVSYLQTCMKWGGLLSYLEANLKGQAQDLQAIQHFQRTKPKCTPPPAHKCQRAGDQQQQQQQQTAAAKVNSASALTGASNS